MTTRIDLMIDKQSRMSVGKLGFSEGHAVAEELADGTGWVIRRASLLTDAELDVLSNAENVAAIEQSLNDLQQGRVVPRRRR